MKGQWLPINLVCAFAFHASVSPAQEWTRFRGPNGSGVSEATTIPSRWTQADFNWKIGLPGVGQSSPVLWGNQLFLTSADETRPVVHLLCIDTARGTVRWQKDFDLVPYPLHPYNTFASATPAVDGQRVYLAWLSRGHYRVGALDHEGHAVWERDLGPFESQHGSGSSPIVYGDRVIVTKDPDGDSFVLALDARDGQTRWQTPLHGTRADYATPCIAEALGPKPWMLFTSMEDGVLALDAQTGALVWQLAKVFTQRCVSSPLIASGLIIGSCGSGAGGNYLAAVRPGNPSERRPPELAYVIRRSAPYVPTSVAYGQWLFLWSDGGIVTCVDAPTGTVHWQERAGGNFFASPICVDGRLFNVSSSGEVVVLKAAEHFEELARNSLGEGTRATPAVSGGRMYVRTFKHLFSVGGHR
jgi:outer membrane protein assembly factor BamB